MVIEYTKVNFLTKCFWKGVMIYFESVVAISGVGLKPTLHSHHGLMRSLKGVENRK